MLNFHKKHHIWCDVWFDDGKKLKSNKSVFCTTDTFSQSFLSINLYFYGFLEKKIEKKVW